MGERRAIALVVATAIAGSAAAMAATTPACTTHKCDDPPLNVIGVDQKHVIDFIDPNTWESSPIDGTWIDYGHRQNIFLYFGGVDDAGLPTHPPVEEVLVYISSDKNPVSAHTNFGLVGGNGAELTYDEGGAGVHILNNTCAEYYARIVVRFAPMTPSPLDAAADAVQDAPSTQ